MIGRCRHRMTETTQKMSDIIVRIRQFVDERAWIGKQRRVGNRIQSSCAWFCGVCTRLQVMRVRSERASLAAQSTAHLSRSTGCLVYARPVHHPPLAVPILPSLFFKHFHPFSLSLSLFYSFHRWLLPLLLLVYSAPRESVHCFFFLLLLV